MKKRIIVLSLLLTSFTMMSFADTPAVNRNIVSSFNKDFSNARDVKWQTTAQYMKAEFKVNDMVFYAYYDKTGDLMAVTRFLSSNQLPTELTHSLKLDYAGFWISNVFEVQTDAGTSYYAEVENADQVILLKSEGSFGWSSFRTENKNHAQ